MSLCIGTGSTEPLLLVYTKNGGRERIRSNTRAPYYNASLKLRNTLVVAGQHFPSISVYISMMMCPNTCLQDAYLSLLDAEFNFRW